MAFEAHYARLLACMVKKPIAKKFMKSLGKSEIKVNPDVEMGVHSGGNKVPNGNLH